MLNFIIMYDQVDFCKKCNSILTPIGNHFNLKKLPYEQYYNTTFILYECSHCKLKYSYHISISKSFS